MEKISLKPQVRELLYKGNESDNQFDVFCYSGSTTQEKGLGSLFVLGYLKQKSDDLSYLISLASSLAKREFFSQESIQAQDSKLAFERVLKKLNEILVDFYKKQEFNLNLGLAVISGENIYISRLGKFKVALARNNEYIDILNNIHLFNKEEGHEQQFANIISGKLLPNDKIFAYFPVRQVTSRERILNPIFINQNQETFSEKIALLASNAENFACCGIHINIQQIREIAVEISPKSSRHELAGSGVVTQPNSVLANETSARIGSTTPPTTSGITPTTSIATGPTTDIRTPSISSKEEAVSPSVIRAELSVGKRVNPIQLIVSRFSKWFSYVRLPRFGRPAGLNQSRLFTRQSLARFLIIALVIVVPIITWNVLRDRIFASNKNIVNQAQEYLRLARLSLNQNDSKEARRLLESAFAQISGQSENKKNILALKADIGQTLDILDHSSDVLPTLYWDGREKKLDLKKIAVYGDRVSAFNSIGRLFSLTATEESELTKLTSLADKSPAFVFSGKTSVASFNGGELIEAYNFDSKKTEIFRLKDAVTAGAVAVYENNLYIITANEISKYADALVGSAKRETWASGNFGGISLAADGNLYVLTADGKLLKFFRGKQEGELDLRITPSIGSQIFTAKDSPFVYLADYANKKAYVFDKTNGDLKTTYKLGSVGEISNISITDTGVIWILGADQKIWQLKP